VGYNKNKLPDATATEKYRKRYKQLLDEVTDFKVYWKDLNDYISPRKGRYLTDDTSQFNEGKKKNQRIINGTATAAVKVLASGMQGGLTSPSMPWFTLGVGDKELQETHNVRVWLEETRNRMLAILSRSNFYGAANSFYRELAINGTGSMLVLEDFKTVIRCRPFTIGEYVLALDSSYRPDTLYRKYSMSVLQMVEEFGYDNVSIQVQQAFDSRQTEQRHDVIHCIQPNGKQEIDAEDESGMAYESVYFEEGTADKDKFLRKSGYKSKPFISSRWDVTGVDTYGDSPAMDALGDIKMLQKMEEKKLKALDKIVDPPMNAPTALRGKGGSVVPGGVNYYDAAQGSTGFTPSYQINLDISNVGVEVQKVEQRIKQTFFNDLFLSILGSEKENMTATEVAKIHEEKLSQLGAVIERIESEFLDPFITRVYNIMENMGVLPEKPEELEGLKQPNIEYISILSQAQRLAKRNSIEGTMAFVGGLAGIQEDIIDKIDFDEAVDVYAASAGMPTGLIRSDEQVAEIREARAAAAEEEKQRMQAQEDIQGAKLLSETKTTPGTALADMEL